MSVLVTGGLGYIGSHTCVELMNAGIDVVVVDNLYNCKKSSYDRIKALVGRDFPFYVHSSSSLLSVSSGLRRQLMYIQVLSSTGVHLRFAIRPQRLSSWSRLSNKK